MDIQTISSLAGLRAVPATIVTYGDALAFIDTLSAAIDAAAVKLNAANTSRRITTSSFNTLVDTQRQTGDAVTALASSFGAQSHGATMSPADASLLQTLEAQVRAFTAGVDAGVGGAAKWVWIGLGAIGVAGAIAWAASKLPSYGRKRRRRRR